MATEVAKETLAAVITTSALGVSKETVYVPITTTDTQVAKSTIYVVLLEPSGRRVPCCVN